MFFVEPPTNPDEIRAQQAAQRAEDDAFFVQALKEIVRLGVDIIQIIHQQVVAQSLDSPHSPIDKASAQAYDNVTRAVRRTVLLARHILKGDPEPKPRQTPPRPQILSDAPEKRERRDTDRLDRLDTLDSIEDLKNRPAQDVLNELRNDIGLAPDPSPTPETQAPSRVQCPSALHQPNKQNPPLPIAPPDPTGPPYPPSS